MALPVKTPGRPSNLHHNLGRQRVWGAECGLGVVELKKEYRQASDPGFVELLRRLRKRDASAVQRLNERVSRQGGERPGVVILAPRRRRLTRSIGGGSQNCLVENIVMRRVSREGFLRRNYRRRKF